MGASFADWLGVAHERGGLDLGTGPVSLTLLVAVAALVTRVATFTGESRSGDSTWKSSPIRGVITMLPALSLCFLS
ncbi:hypothetical protein ACFQ1S_06010 [Kibdelosporangium lantanae]|uniref:Uncharacterized protein n=1 Tax=Kibdelosporangium lantanae TaxID=1497396 RepID=A0ABW3M588_9PSEU